MQYCGTNAHHQNGVDIPMPLSQEWLSEIDTVQDGRTEVHTNRVREESSG